MRLTIAIPVFNQLADSKGPLGTFRYMTSDKAEFLFIDNGSTDPVEDFVRKFLKPKRLNYIRNSENLGMIKTIQQAIDNCSTEILALTHNDVFVYEKDWDVKILKYFEEMPDLGGVGFFGAQGCGPIGERIQDVPMGRAAGWSNMLEADLHGMRLEKDWHPVSMFDGFFQAFRVDMLKEAGGIDQRYHYHHLYDRHLSLVSLALGYKNIVVDIPCHHLCGLTANRAEYQTWIDKKLDKENYTGDKWTHDENTKIFTRIWDEVLPLYVESDFSYRTGQFGPYEFKGNKIVGYNWKKENNGQG